MRNVRILGMVLVLFTAVPAFAQTEGQFQVALDMHPVFRLSGGGGASAVSFGLDARPGYAMEMEGFTLVPEAVIGWNSFATGTSMASAGLWRFLAGARAVFEMGELAPAAYAHFGYGHHYVSWNEERLMGMVIVEGGSESSGTGIFEIGGALDYQIDENLFVGGHLGLNFMTASGGGTFMNLGIGGGYRF